MSARVRMCVCMRISEGGKGGRGERRAERYLCAHYCRSEENRYIQYIIINIYIYIHISLQLAAQVECQQAIRENTKIKTKAYITYVRYWLTGATIPSASPRPKASSRKFPLVLRPRASMNTPGPSRTPQRNLPLCSAPSGKVLMPSPCCRGNKYFFVFFREHQAKQI